LGINKKAGDQDYSSQKKSALDIASLLVNPHTNPSQGN
jgi:hypothetical protein